MSSRNQNPARLHSLHQPLQPGAPNVQQLINRAIQEFEEYQRLTAEGKLGEAGKKLEDHKRTLEELKKATGKPSVPQPSVCVGAA